MVTPASTFSPAPGRKLIAPVWHTVLLVSIFLGVTIAGALFQRHAQSTPGALQQHPNVVPLYLSIIAVEWLLVYGVWAGIKTHGVQLRDLIGGRWNSAKEVLIDLALAIVVWFCGSGFRPASAAWFQLMPSPYLRSSLRVFWKLCFGLRLLCLLASVKRWLSAGTSKNSLKR